MIIDYNNYKPFRTKAQKKIARQNARKCVDGTWRSSAPVSYHKPVDKDNYRSYKCKHVSQSFLE